MRVRRLLFPVLAVTLATLSIGACRQAIGLDDYHAASTGPLAADAGVDADADGTTGAMPDVIADGGTDADGNAIADVEADTNACGMTYGAGTCSACAATKCCPELAACANGVCAPYEACLGACNGDPSCRSQCTIDSTVGESTAVSKLNACLATACATDCSLRNGAFAGYIAEPSVALDCQTCIAANAPDAESALGTSVDGDAYWRCVLANTTEDLRQACAAAHPYGATLFTTFKSAWSGTCAASCGYGNYWACLGKVSWPPVANAGLVTSTIHVVDFGRIVGNKKAPLAGVTVTACAGCPCGGDAGVSTALDQATTDVNGNVTLQYPNVVDTAGHGLNGCYDVTSPSLVEMYVYWNYPMSVGSDTTADPTDDINAVTPAELQQLLIDEGVDAGEVPLDLTTRGDVAGVVKDCLGNPTPHATLSINPNDPTVHVFYGMNLAAATVTDPTGTGGFYDVPGGAPVITVQPAGLTRPSGAYSVQVKLGVITEEQFYPQP